MRKGGYYAVKEAVLPFNRFPGVDILLGPEMRSAELRQQKDWVLLEMLVRLHLPERAL